MVAEGPSDQVVEVLGTLVVEVLGTMVVEAPRERVAKALDTTVADLFGSTRAGGFGGLATCMATANEVAGGVADSTAVPFHCE